MACVKKRRGKWVADWRDGAGSRRWKTFRTQREAQDFLDLERPKARQWMKPLVDPNSTVNEYQRHWLSLIAPTVKPRTLESYTETLTNHIVPLLGAIKIRQLDRGRIKAFLSDKLSTGRLPRKQTTAAAVSTGLSRNSVRIIHATLRAMLKAAIDDGILVANPAEKLGRQSRLVTSKAARQETIKAMTREQRQQFLVCAARETPRHYPLFFTLAGTGMRLGEGLALSWDNIDVLSREIRIAKILSAGLEQTPKSGHGRTVDMSTPLAETLGRLEVARKAETLRHGWPAVPTWVFCGPTGAPMDEHHVRKMMRRVIKTSGLPCHFTPHCLRHTYASLMLQQGEPITYVQRQLGHASIQLTVDTYGKWLPMGNKQAVDRLDELESGSRMVANDDHQAVGKSEVVEVFGGPCRGRTYGPLIKSQLLYQLS